MLEKRTEKIEYTPPYDALKTYEKIIADSAKSFLRSNQGRSSPWSTRCERRERPRTTSTWP